MSQCHDAKSQTTLKWDFGCQILRAALVSLLPEDEDSRTFRQVHFSMMKLIMLNFIVCHTSTAIILLDLWGAQMIAWNNFSLHWYLKSTFYYRRRKNIT